MKHTAFVAFAATATAAPVAKVVALLGDLEKKILAEGESAHKVYAEFAEWCEDTSRTGQFEIKTGKSNVAKLNAQIANEGANIDSQAATIEGLASHIASDEADLKAATTIRSTEAADFAGKEKELLETVDTIGRAIGIIEREMKGGASMMQLKNAGSVVQALKVLVSAESLSNADEGKLSALLQSSSDDDDSGAPAGSVYDSHSNGVVDVLNDLLEKANSQLDEARKTEVSDKNNFLMLKQSLTDEISFENKEMAEARKSKAASEEAKAVADGDLDFTTKDLQADTKQLAGLHHNCMTKAEEFEAETKSRGEELKALADAKKVLVEATSFAQSFVQVGSQIDSRAGLAGYEVVRMVRDLSKKENSPELAQLASRVAATVRFDSGSQADIFGKVKGLISDMISKLESESDADATEKSFCDKEMAETTQKKADKAAEIAKLSAKSDSLAAKSANLKEQIATLESQLADLARSQATMGKIRGDEKQLFGTSSAETKEALDGVQVALKILNDYYSNNEKAHTAADGSSTGIIGLLEVCESDFSKSLAVMTATEDNAAVTYDAQSKENAILRTLKNQDVKYKTQESTALDKMVAELGSDVAGVSTEQAAVMDYLKQLTSRCVAVAETYSQRSSRRAAEIAGLKNALSILENETALIQKKTSRSLRMRRN